MNKERKLPKLFWHGKKERFNGYLDGMKTRFRMEGSNHVGLMRKITGFL